MRHYFRHTDCFGYQYGGFPIEDIFIYMGLLLSLILVSSKIISWVLPKSKKAYSPIVNEPVEVNIFPLEPFETYQKETSLLVRLFIIALILLFVFQPISEVLHLI